MCGASLPFAQVFSSSWSCARGGRPSAQLEACCDSCTGCAPSGRGVLRLASSRPAQLSAEGVVVAAAAAAAAAADAAGDADGWHVAVAAAAVMGAAAAAAAAIAGGSEQSDAS